MPTLPVPQDVPLGAVWRRVDLHLHTPGVKNFRLPPGSDPSTDAGRATLAEAYVQQLVDAGIEIAALTDYQGVRVEWFDVIRQGAAAHGIVVLPGAEMSIGRGGGKGLHLLVVCGPETSPAEINDMLRHQDKEGRTLFEGRGQHRDINLRFGPAEALEELRSSLDCVVIAAHARDKNGVLKELGPDQTADLIKRGLIDALDQCADASISLQGTGVLSPERLASLACMRSSDPKALDEIGTKTHGDGRLRATWLKLSSVDAAALRLALHDPQTRVLTRAPTDPMHARILSMEVEGAGFLGNLAVRWNDDLNCLIGGRGAGKSAILETLRYGLGAEPFSDHSERQDLLTHALGSGGQVRLLVERPGPQRGQRYAITRVLGQQPRVFDTQSRDHVQVPPMELFGSRGRPMILLQREIQAVSRDEAFRLRLLDEIIGDEAREADLQIRRMVEDLRRNARELAAIEERLAKRDDFQTQLARLDVEISFYESQGVADKLERHGRLAADGVALSESAARVADAAEVHAESAGELRDQLSATGTALRGAVSESAPLLVDLATRADATLLQVGELMGEVGGQVAQLLVELNVAQGRWSALVEPLGEELRRLQAELQTAQLDPGRFITAIRERTSLRPIVEGMDQHEVARDRLLEIRRDLLRQLQDGRRAANGLRRTAADAVNGQLAGKLALAVRYLADVDDFRTRLGAAVRGSGVSSDALDRVVETQALDGVELAAAVGDGPEALSDKFGLSSAHAQRLAAWLGADAARLRELELLAPRDQVDILLDVDGSPRDLGRLSSGQRATALLMLLFAQRGRLLVLDQPEDDLDNRFVYEDVVALLREEKGVQEPNRRRQLIVATHNANIPVNGDAELVISLSADAGRCNVQARGSIDSAKVRGEIRTILEGGAEAFRRRAEKYGGLDDAG